MSLECSFFVSESNELVKTLPVKWFWQDRPIGNNSKGILSNQIFLIHESEGSFLFNDSNEREVKALVVDGVPVISFAILLVT